MVIHISHSPEETLELGRLWARELREGAVIGLSGDLGAGKTQLVKGIAKTLGVKTRVHSPTFSLINNYSGGMLPLAHLDLYRLSGKDEIIQAGLEEYLRNPAGIAVIEWVDRWFESERPTTENVPARWYRHVTIDTISETERRICHEDFGT